MVSTMEIRVSSPFKDIFPIREDVLKEIVEDMKKHGFDKSRPIVLWQGHKSIVLDGHTRLLAAAEAGITEVPIEFKEFSTEEDALAYTIRCQRNRRNLTDQEILQCINELDKRKSKAEAGGMKRKKQAQRCTCFGRTSLKTASILGISGRKVEQARAVLDKAPDEIKDAVKSGKMSINKAYKKTMNAQKESPEVLGKTKDGTSSIKKVINIVKKRLSTEQIREMIKLLHEEGI